MTVPRPEDLDAQSDVSISRWIDVDSEEAKELDDNREFTKKILRLGFEEPAFLAVDANGRIWGRGENGRYYPFHFESGRNLIGYRLAKKAAN